jgi:hypothetical protein
MAAGATYEPIATTTLVSAAASHTFSSIPATYTDLFIVANFGFSGTGQTFRIRYNADAASNYSFTELYGNGSTAASGRLSAQTGIYSGIQIAPSRNLDNNFLLNIQNYANTTTFKTSLSRQNTYTDTLPGTNTVVGLWRSTAAITSISLTPTNSQNIIIGSTLTLYGIAAA